MNKTGLIIGGVAIAGIFLYFLVSKQQTAQSQALNQPGLSSGATSALGTVSSLLSGSGALSGLSDAFGSGDSGSNDPGLYDSSDFGSSSSYNDYAF